jgi:hypothetical protein
MLGSMELHEELRALIAALDDDGVEHALCGALALAVYGPPRATADIDLLIPSDSVEEASAAARALGYTIPAKQMVLSEGDIEIVRLSKADADSGQLLSLDLVLAHPALEEVWRSRERVEWEDGELSVVSREGLVAMKRLRGSAQDLADIEALERTDED